MTNWRDHFKISDEKTNLSLALKKNLIDETSYQKWASLYYKLPVLTDKWFEKKLDENFWNPIKDKAEWNSSLVPLCHWEDTLFIACLEPPQKLSLNQKTVFLLSSVDNLEVYWSRLNSSISREEKKTISEFKIKKDGKKSKKPSIPKAEPYLFENEDSSEDGVFKEDIEYLPVHWIHKFKDFLSQLFFSPSSKPASFRKHLSSRKPPLQKQNLQKTKEQKEKSKKDSKPEPKLISLKVEEANEKEINESDKKEALDSKKLSDDSVEKISEDNKNLNEEKLHESSSPQDTSPAKEEPDEKTILLLDSNVDSVSSIQEEKISDKQEKELKEESLKELSEDSEEKLPEEKLEKESSEKKQLDKQTQPFVLIDSQKTETEDQKTYKKEAAEIPPPSEKSSLRDILEKTKTHLDHYILFIFKDQKFEPVEWSSKLSPKKKVHGFVSSPSIFRICYKSKKPYFGHLAPILANNSFFENWGFNPPPNHVVLIPILDKTRSRILGGYLGISQTKTLSTNFLNLIQKLTHPLNKFFRDKNVLKKVS